MTTTTAPTLHQDPRPMDARLTLAQITKGCLWSVGASDIRMFSDAVLFKARIHPRRQDGKRASAARVMDVQITLGGDDLYRVSVRYFVKASLQTVTHWEGTGIYGEDMARLFLSFDSGTESRD